ncbi:NADPH:quinone reductase-like Zn-dependent oxidoreductase [Stackebrandtia endophytica]|uniref:NADPH:quinone reductase-like Zn-dependent oxidoreductase n=1 Tax=Stackebrandtia endophytica TaxID=1496996 RepID=A0A543B0R8_9ACTN|nr:NADPH:quinone reductase-like Zn-dependent oxidoreductase [Stackebrandtia endophytica]
MTGATGTVGKAMVNALRRRDLSVTALTRDHAVADLPADVEVVTGDLTKPASVIAAAREADAVFLTWPLLDTGAAEATVAGLAKTVRRIVYLSSADVVIPEPGPGVDVHRRLEKLIAASGVEWTFLRPHAFAANALRWAEQIRSGDEVRGPDGAATTAPIDERDIAEVAVRSLLAPGHHERCYLLTGPELLDSRDQLRIIADAVTRPLKWIELSHEDAAARFGDTGWPAAIIEAVLAAQASLVERPGPLTDTVESITGTAARPFRDWAAEHRSAFTAEATMRAARVHEYGGAEVIRIDTVPRPEPGDGEVSIKVAGAGFNPSDIGFRSGFLHDILPVTLPITLGSEVAGTIVSIGPDVDRWRVGDTVFGRIDGGGGQAEYAVAAQDEVVAAPTTIALADASVIPVAGLTAAQAVAVAGVDRGHRVLVNGAGGGVGGFVVQLATAAGAHVVATASSRSASTVRRQGASRIVDYRTTSVSDYISGADALINLVALDPEEATALGGLVRPGGRIVSITGPIPVPADSSIVSTQVLAVNDTDRLAELVALVDNGLLMVDVSQRRRLRDLAQLHRDSEAGLLRGKVVIVP